ncbi:MAG: cyclic nucleotide-binding domain-containing protein [Candidatus Marinimicrobia bacterium]|nr:cyclic nucleotide-binding domain-containing protein [Candidatus Neomarinimicrobiota bacterium]
MLIIDSNEISSETVNFPAGTTIIQEGDDDRKLYVLLEGKCVVYKHGVEITSFSEEGTIFGEMCMILNVSRTATVKAAIDVKVHVLKIDLNTMLVKYPEMTKKILQRLARRVATETETIFTHLATVDLDELGL